MQNSNDAATSQNQSMGYPANIDPHLSRQEAVNALRSGAPREVNLFIEALQMQNPVPYEAAAKFLALSVKDGLPPDSTGLADNMRQQDWEQYLSSGEDLQVIGERAETFLRTEDGISLINFFIKTIAKTNDSIF
jgi:hypothetical protein